METIKQHLEHTHATPVKKYRVLCKICYGETVYKKGLSFSEAFSLIDEVRGKYPTLPVFIDQYREYIIRLDH